MELSSPHFGIISQSNAELESYCIEEGKLKIYYFQRRGYWGNGFIPLPPPKFNYKIYKRVKMLKYIIEILKYIVEILKYIVEMLKYIKEILKYRIKLLK